MCLTSYNNLINKIIKIIPNNLLDDIHIYINKLFPIMPPNIGNRKWNIPTVIIKVVWRWKVLVNKANDNDNEKVSMLKARAIMIRFIIDIYSPNNILL